MHPVVAIVVCALLILLGTARAQPSCLSGNDVSGPGSVQFNQACQATPLTPYCPAGSVGQCTPCDPNKSLETGYCDCAPNQYCDKNAQSPTFATCRSFAAGAVTCQSSRQCYDNVEQWYWSCVNGFCSPCNQVTFQAL